MPRRTGLFDFFTFRNNGFVSKHTSKNNQLKALSIEIRTFRGSSSLMVGHCHAYFVFEQDISRPDSQPHQG